MSAALAGRVAIVTGASRGLGRAIAEALAGAGASVALAGRSVPDLEVTAARVRAHGVRALPVATDVTVFGDLEHLVERTVAQLGGLDILVNNAGVARVQPLAETAPAVWHEMLGVNLTGMFHGCRAAARHLLERGAGKVINLSSIMAGVGLAGYTSYAATKGGVIAFTRALGVEWARHNVQVNAIAPGWFGTEMSAPAFGGEHPEIAARLLRDVPARRIGRPEEIAPLAVYLASAASDFMTGQTLFLDGGHSAA